MENLPYNDFEQLIQLLQTTYSGDNNQVKAATQVFKQMSADFTHFLDSMMMVIMTDNNTQEFIKVKNAACLIFTSFLPQVIDGNNYPLEKKNYIANAIITAMCSDKVALTQKLTLQAVLRKMYNKDMSAYLRNQGLLFVKEKLCSENIHEFATALLVFQGIVNTPETTRQAIAEWLVSLRSFIMSAGDNLVNGIVSEINQFMQGTNNQQDKISSISIGLKTLKIWVSLIQDCLQILRKPDEKTRLVTNFVEVIVNEESIVKLFSNILALQVPNNKQIQQCLISTSGFVEIDQPLNALKTIVLKAFNRFLETLIAGKSLLDFTKTKFYDFIKDDGVKGILNSVFLLCKSEELNIDEILKDRSLNDCLVECLIHLTHLTMFSHFNDIFSDYNKQLLQDICLPLMRSEEHELALFFDNHLQFVYLGVDVCNKQESQTVKTQAAQLLESICDNTHGALSYLVVLVCNIIEYSLIYGTPDQATQAHDTLDLRCKIISQTDPVKRVETCLLALGPISYLVAERSDLVGFLEQLLTKYQTFFLGEKSDPIIKARVCLLFGYYCDALFQEEEKYDMFVLYLKFVVECIGLQTPEYGALSDQAIDSLAFIFRQEEMNQKMVNFIDEILERLLVYAKTTNFVKLFEIFEEINDEYRQNLKRNPTLLVAFLSTLTARAQLEYENAKQNKRNNRIILTKIWNIFRGIAENRLFIPVFQEDIEKIISPLFAYLHTEEKVIFEEDIIKYMIAVIKCAKTVSPLCWEIFKAFPKIFMRAQTISSLLFMALNLTIVYGRNVLENDPGAIKTLVDMGIHTLTYCKSKGDEVFVAKGALLLQLVLQYFDKISEEDWNRILGVCIDKIFQAHKGFVKSRLGGVVLCAFLRKFELTQAILINKNALTGILDLFLKNTLIFNAHPYDRKLLIIGLSSFLPQRNVHQTAYQRYPELLNVLVSLLKYVQFLDDKNANKNKNTRGGTVGLVDEEEAILRSSSVLERFLHDTPEGAVLDKREDENLINSENYFSPAREEEKDENDTRDKDDEDEDEEDDEDSDNDNFFNDYSDQAEANIIVDKLETELKVKDEFTIFKEALHEMKAIGETIIMDLVNRLSSEKKDFLREIMQSQRVAIDESGGKTETRRIVKPRTRKIATNIGKNQD